MKQDAVPRLSRVPAALVAAGMGIELLASLHWTPATFILSTATGIPLVLVGVVLFLRLVWRAQRSGVSAPPPGGER